jgi:Mg2+ and Co2+ transporter CorA
LLSDLAGALQIAFAQQDSARRDAEERRQEIEADRRAADETRTKRLTWITSSIAAVAVPLTLITGFFGMNTKPVVQDAISAFDTRYVVWYVGLLAVLLGAITIGILGSRARQR